MLVVLTPAILKKFLCMFFPSETRAKLASLVKRNQRDFTLYSVKKYAVLCSEHFEYSCNSSPSVPIEGFKFQIKLLPGSVPTRDTVLPTGPAVLSEGRKRGI